MTGSTSSLPAPRTVLVTATLTLDGAKRLLIAKRKSDASVEAGKWEFPGGKVEFGEDPSACLRREIKEELNLEIQVGRIADVVSHVYETARGPLHVVLLFFTCRLQGRAEDLRLLDAADARWIELIDLAKYDFAVADRPVVEKLKTGALQLS